MYIRLILVLSLGSILSQTSFDQDFFCSKQVLINTNVAVVKLLSGVVCRLYYQNAESVDRV